VSLCRLTARAQDGEVRGAVRLASSDDWPRASDVLQSVRGVLRCERDAVTGTVTVVYDPAATGLRTCLETLAKVRWQCWNVQQGPG
jgi:hypothetical protein